nr:hypothetical protein [uncultured archaeon]
MAKDFRSGIIVERPRTVIEVMNHVGFGKVALVHGHEAFVGGSSGA